jgi:hypothetical protein
VTADPASPLYNSVRVGTAEPQPGDQQWEIASVEVRPGTPVAPLPPGLRNRGGPVKTASLQDWNLEVAEANTRRKIEGSSFSPAPHLQYVGDGADLSGLATASPRTDAPPDAVVTTAKEGDKSIKLTVLHRQTGMGDFLAALVEIQDNSHPGHVTATKHLYRYNFNGKYWDDVTALASSEGKGELSIEWNMPQRLTDEDYVRKIKGPGIVYGLMPLHATPYLKDQTLQIRNPNTRFEASSTQTELRNADYATTQLVVQNLPLLLDAALLPGQISRIASALRPRAPAPPVMPELPAGGGVRGAVPEPVSLQSGPAYRGPVAREGVPVPAVEGRGSQGRLGAGSPPSAAAPRIEAEGMAAGSARSRGLARPVNLRPQRGSVDPIGGRAGSSPKPPAPPASKPATRGDLRLAEEDLRDLQQKVKAAQEIHGNSERRLGDLEALFEERGPNASTQLQENLAKARQAEVSARQSYEQRMGKLQAAQARVAGLRQELAGRGELEPELRIEWNLPDKPTAFRYKGVEAKSWRSDGYVGVSQDRGPVERILNQEPDGELAKRLLDPNSGPPGQRKLFPANVGDMDHWKQHPEITEMAHVLSKREGGRDVCIVMTKARNQTFSANLERTGGVFKDDAIVIQGVAVDRLSAIELGVPQAVIDRATVITFAK